jgi:anti-sigma factor RsiW
MSKEMEPLRPYESWPKDVPCPAGDDLFISLYLKGELSPEDEESFGTHLVVCPRCVRAVEISRAVAARAANTWLGRIKRLRFIPARNRRSSASRRG